jgi:hypothetical protein
MFFILFLAFWAQGNGDTQIKEKATHLNTHLKNRRKNALDNDRAVSKFPFDQALLSFQNIERIKDLGTYCWDPTGLKPKLIRELAAQEILQGLKKRESMPHMLVPMKRFDLPITFHDLPPQYVLNAFPEDAGVIVPLYVAKERGIDLSKVDFILGGSALKAFADQKVPQNSRYLVQKCPVTGIISLGKSDMYLSNYAEIGFQFERLLTGRNMDDAHDHRKFRRLQLMKIGGFTVLISAEIDAIDQYGIPAELKSYSQKAWASRDYVWQMMSSGAGKLMIAQRDGQTMHGVRTRSFYNMVQRNMMIKEHKERLLAQERNIVQTLQALKSSTEIAHDKPMQLDFERNHLALTPYNSGDLLPSSSVVRELLGSTSDRRYTYLPRLVSSAYNAQKQPGLGSLLTHSLWSVGEGPNLRIISPSGKKMNPDESAPPARAGAGARRGEASHRQSERRYKRLNGVGGVERRTEARAEPLAQQGFPAQMPLQSVPPVPKLQPFARVAPHRAQRRAPQTLQLPPPAPQPTFRLRHQPQIKPVHPGIKLLANVVSVPSAVLLGLFVGSGLTLAVLHVCRSMRKRSRSLF